MKMTISLFAGLGALALAACGDNTPAASTQDDPASETAVPDNGARLDAILAGDHRSPEERARDQYRHPKQTLLFFGLEPDMHVVEIWPGGGWYTQIIAPFLKPDGKYYAAGFPREGASERTRNALTLFEETYADKPEIYGNVEMTALGEGHEIAPPGTADMVLTFRNVHNWLGRDTAAANFAAFYRALKPGGILGVVEHRADSAELPHDGSKGYVYKADVIALAQAAGFDLDAASEVNANPSDTKNHPFGVWTLPPVRRSSEIRGMEDPDFDRAPYDAIGESDRMTLKFRKPIAADGALLE